MNEVTIEIIEPHPIRKEAVRRLRIILSKVVKFFLPILKRQP
jgi:hypothetical protein